VPWRYAPPPGCLPQLRRAIASPPVVSDASGLPTPLLSAPLVILQAAMALGGKTEAGSPSGLGTPRADAVPILIASHRKGPGPGRRLSALGALVPCAWLR